ncbi:hypothetical protein SBOR_3593 [Sclerotinia borealis F-4128]|uniref:Uncharacterized protein n=1 Tax=Sclerotinia borealis (strain F-4128) TaxID=1432307 RepID=W9CND1_SCLBF|nr:hypothetical protein SBOR_3593 [Sclerotinia borealis F-4128]
MSSSSSDARPWVDVHGAAPASVDNRINFESISPISLPRALYPKFKPTQEPIAERLVYRHRHRYSKQEMVYRAIDEKIDLVRFLQAYESVLDAFGVDEAEERGREGGEEREGLELAERIVYRLFWNERTRAENMGRGSVPLARAVENLDAGLNSPECLRIAVEPAIDTIGKKDQMILTVTEVTEVAGETDVSIAVIATDEAIVEGPSISAGLDVNTTGTKDLLTSTIAEAVEVPGETNLLNVSIVRGTTGELVDGDPCTSSEHAIDTTGKMDPIVPKTSTVSEISNGPHAAIAGTTKYQVVDRAPYVAAESASNITAKKDQTISTTAKVAELPIHSDVSRVGNIPSQVANGGSSTVVSRERGIPSHVANGGSSNVVFIKPDLVATRKALYEEMIQGPRIVLLKRWGCDRYAEWIQEHRNAEEDHDEDAKRENFRLVELKHQLLPLISGKLPYTYRIVSSTQDHRDSYTSTPWGMDGVQITEKLLNVRLQWTCEAGTHNDITIEPMSLDELAAHETDGHEILMNAYNFLGFWDWFVGQSIYLFEGKVRPMNIICVYWLDPNHPSRKIYCTRKPNFKPAQACWPGACNCASEKGRNECSGSKKLWSWREKCTGSGGEGEGGWTGGKKRTVSGNSLTEKKGGHSTKGPRRTPHHSAVYMMDAMDNINRGVPVVKKNRL